MSRYLFLSVATHPSILVDSYTDAWLRVPSKSNKKLCASEYQPLELMSPHRSGYIWRHDGENEKDRCSLSPCSEFKRCSSKVLKLFERCRDHLRIVDLCFEMSSDLISLALYLRKFLSLSVTKNLDVIYPGNTTVLIHGVNTHRMISIGITIKFFYSIFAQK